ncbi:MAG: hypothetical protein IKT07_05645 [Oscillospiraceae bacterium]|nr:hypothetical protein [Oscillospiraceae bacterium]
MNALIICTGRPAVDLSGSYTSQEFDTLQRSLLYAGIEAQDEKRIVRKDRPVFCGEGKPARMTAEVMLDERGIQTEPLLNEIIVVSAEDSEKKYSYSIWQKKAAAQRKRSDSRQPESRKAARQRAEELLEKLEQTEDSCILIVYPLFLEELLEVFRTRGYIAQRSKLGKIQPMERILVSHRGDHCGGCSHNCFLSNPGCGVGRDKAARQKRK